MLFIIARTPSIISETQAQTHETTAPREEGVVFSPAASSRRRGGRRSPRRAQPGGAHWPQAHPVKFCPGLLAHVMYVPCAHMRVQTASLGSIAIPSIRSPGLQGTKLSDRYQQFRRILGAKRDEMKWEKKTRAMRNTVHGMEQRYLPERRTATARDKLIEAMIA